MKNPKTWSRPSRPHMLWTLLSRWPSFFPPPESLPILKQAKHAFYSRILHLVSPLFAEHSSHIYKPASHTFSGLIREGSPYNLYEITHASTHTHTPSVFYLLTSPPFNSFHSIYFYLTCSMGKFASHLPLQCKLHESKGFILFCVEFPTPGAAQYM